MKATERKGNYVHIDLTREDAIGWRDSGYLVGTVRRYTARDKIALRLHISGNWKGDTSPHNSPRGLAKAYEIYAPRDVPQKVLDRKIVAAEIKEIPIRVLFRLEEEDGS